MGEIVADTIASHNQVLCRGFGRGLTLCYISSWMELISPFDFVKRSILAVQEYTYLSLRSLTNLFRKPLYMADTIQQADLIGVGSLPIVVLTGMFTGVVLALNTSKTLEQFGSLSLTGRLVSFSMVRELGPVLTSLMVAGRNASGMASELGSMKVTEQIDAMRALGTDPYKKLVTPRVLSTIFMMFFLTIISDLVGLVGGWIISFSMLGLDSTQYWNSAYQALNYNDVITGLAKPLVFGFIIATVGCYFGMTTKGGTQGVGRSTTEAVVWASVIILAVDAVLTQLFITLG
ncbi:MAG TPA: ABC transporter permease [Blattabacteriaceae bacterium]|nr:ABC transporter permease [Blattabacteriaceae bacterium]